MAAKGHTLDDLKRERQQIEHQLGELQKHFDPKVLLEYATATTAIYDLELRDQEISSEDYIEIERRCLHLARTELVDLERDPTTMPIPRMGAYKLDQRTIASVHNVIDPAEYTARIYALGVDPLLFASYVGYKRDRGVRRQMVGDQVITQNAVDALAQLEQEADKLFDKLETEAVDEGTITIPRVPSQSLTPDPDTMKGVIPEAVYACIAGRLHKHYPDAKVGYCK